jgi:hypothetical protein
MGIHKKYLSLDWHKRPDGRKFKYRHNSRVSNVYLQVLRFEIVVWYR